MSVLVLLLAKELVPGWPGVEVKLRLRGIEDDEEEDEREVELVAVASVLPSKGC